MLTFLEANGHRVDVADPELAEWIIGLSGGPARKQPAERTRPSSSPPRRAELRANVKAPTMESEG